jgi:hypothetical protein
MLQLVSKGRKDTVLLEGWQARGITSYTAEEQTSSLVKHQLIG